MKRRWYFSSLIVILTILGAVYQQQISVPNQEIIVQFTDVELTSDEAQHTIASVKQQLQDVGATNIYVKLGAKGQLKITYYSEVDAASIKKVLSNEKLELGYASHYQDKEPSELPSGEKYSGYNLNVYELQNANDTDWDIDGIYVLELKPKTDRSFNPNSYVALNEVDPKNSISKTRLKLYTGIAIAIDNTSYKIPEVRAGPAC